MAETLGSYLKTLRERAGLSLRAVEADCPFITNGYLSLLEHDKVKEPSPKILWGLAKYYHVDYLHLMRIAGYPVPDTPGVSEQPSVVFWGAERLDPEDRKEIQQLIKWKLQRREGKG